jgi:hypothetical protein
LELISDKGLTRFTPVVYYFPARFLVRTEEIKMEAVQMVISVSKHYPALKEDLKTIAESQGRSLSNMVTLVLANFVEQNKK